MNFFVVGPPVTYMTCTTENSDGIVKPLRPGGVLAKGTPTVKSVDDIWIKSKATNIEIDVIVTVSRWRDGSAVGKV